MPGASGVRAWFREALSLDEALSRRALARTAALVGGMLACLLGQAALNEAALPSRNATFLFRTHPRGATAYRYVVQPDHPWVRVGTTPSLWLHPRDLPCQVKVELWGYHAWSGRVEIGDLARSARGLEAPVFPSAGPLVLTPRVQFLVPLLYSLRDWPGLYLAGLFGVALAAHVGRYRREVGRRRMLRRSLEAGRFVEGVEMGPYRLDGILGAGGMGRVYRAHRQGEPGGEVLAVKVLARSSEGDESNWRAFVREADICRGLSHPNVVPLLDWGEVAGHLYLVMEHVDGETLQARIRRGRLSPCEACRIGLGVSEALVYTHARGIVHRDIKPGNIMLTPAGQVKVLDFGIARSEHLDPLPEVGMITGTPSYLAPETIGRREGDWRADYYSLGVTLFEALSGHVPFRTATTKELLRCHVAVEPPSLLELRPDLPPDLVEVVHDLLAKYPDQRAQEPEEVRDRLRVLAERLGAV